MWFFTADWHLNHANIIKYCNRPFLDLEEQSMMKLVNNGTISIKDVSISYESVERMNSCIINSVNQTVSENDNLVIIGDVCWSSTPTKILKQIFSKIRCKNLFLIWGNNDNKKTFSRFFKGTYDQHTFVVEGQKIFTSHYPCRLWPFLHKGSWMLYGHAHGSLSLEDDNLLTQEEENELNLILNSHLDEISNFEKLKCDIAKVFRKNFFTLDVGVDNIREGVPFGTPWSFNELLSYMEKKSLNLKLSP